MTSKIEWTDKTWNLVTGCSKVSLGCEHCYAERMAKRLAGRYGYPEAPHHFDVTLHPERLDEPLKRRKPTMYFLCSMGDLFHEDVSTTFIADVWNIMRQCPQHTFQILTKRPYPMLSIVTDWGIVLPNVWLGVTAENQAMADKRIPLLLQTPAAVRFVSAEPLLRSIDLDLYLPNNVYERNAPLMNYHKPGPRLDWVIIGGESGPGARPMHPQWVRDVRDQCQAAGTPWFFKQWGAWTPGATYDYPFGPAEIGERCIEHDGKWTRMYRVGKKRAGHLLDSEEYREFPA